MIQIRDNEQIRCSFSGIDAAGNPAPLEDMNLASSDTSILIVVKDGDGFIIQAMGPLGSAQVQASADAKIGPDVSLISGTETIEVIASDAVAIQLKFGSPEVKS